MKINNYYSLPSVPCKYREMMISEGEHSEEEENLGNLREETCNNRKNICENINANKVYNSLYPNNNPSAKYNPPLALRSYYYNYKKSGNEGDFFCKYVDNKCEILYEVGKNGRKKYNNSMRKKKQYVPPHSVCMPPKCLPSKGISENSNLEGILKINSDIEIGCKKDNKNQCLDNIHENNLYRNNDLGLATKHYTPNPPNMFLPYKQFFHEYKNLQVEGGCDVKKICDNSAPKPDAFNLNSECENWCLKSDKCNAISYYNDTNGKAICKYYADSPDNIKNRLIRKVGNKVLIKQNPTFVNNTNEYNSSTNNSSQKCCIEAFSCSSNRKNKVPKKPVILENDIINSNSFGRKNSNSNENGSNLCPNKKREKIFTAGPLCSSIVDITCNESEYGCCPDTKTAKIDKDGTNCPVTNDSVCLNSELGCCPGTITPREFLFKCPGKTEKEKKNCKIFSDQLFNCELSKNMVGDPDSYKSQACTKSEDCNFHIIGVAYISVNNCNINNIRSLLMSAEYNNLFTLANKEQVIESGILENKIDNKRIKDYDFYFDGYQNPFELSDTCDRNICKSLSELCNERDMVGFYFLVSNPQFNILMRNNKVKVQYYKNLMTVKIPYVIGIISNKYTGFNSRLNFAKSQPSNILSNAGINATFTTRTELLNSNFFNINGNQKFKSESIYFKNPITNRYGHTLYCLDSDTMCNNPVNGEEEESNENVNMLTRAYLSFTKTQWDNWKRNHSTDSNFNLITYSLVSKKKIRENFLMNKCINGYCTKRNPLFYNSLLRGPKRASIEHNSGISMLNYLPNVTSTQQVMDSRYEGCPDANVNNAGCRLSQAMPLSYNNEETGISSNTNLKYSYEVCPKTVEPVCGANGKTYKNGCMAKKMGVNVEYYGPCKILENFQVEHNFKIKNNIALCLFLVLIVAIMIYFIIIRKNK